MKTYTRSLLLIAFTVFSLFILVNFSQEANKKSVPQSQITSTTSLGLPTRLVIPAINVDTNVQHIGITPKGEMQVPTNITDVGWLELGSRPGEKGSTVIAGHFDGINGQTAVFTNLHLLKTGDMIYVQDSKGASLSFTVRESRIYGPGYADEVFSQNDIPHLNLITCDGVWDGTKKSYSKRLVVFADIAR